MSSANRPVEWTADRRSSVTLRPIRRCPLSRPADPIARSHPEDFGGDYVVLCCEFGAVLGHVMRARQPRLFWYLDWPYWESMLLDPQTGTVIPVFHWAIKKMSDYGVDDGFVPKIERCLRILDGDEA